MAIIFPILSTFDPKGVNQATKSFKGITNEANLLKTAFAGVGIAAIVRGLQSTVMAASNLSESVSKANVVFGKNAAEIQAWSKTTARALGVSQQAALEAAGTYGNLFRAFGIGEGDTARMSTSLVQLAADLASFNNTNIDDALLALRSGLSGETEPLKRFGIAINDVRLKEQALSMGLIKTTSGVLPQAIKTQAAYALIMKDSALAQGDVSRTAGGLANQLKFLQAGLKDAKAAFGEALLPVVLNLVNAFNQQLLPALTNTTKAFSTQGVSGGFKTAIVEISNLINNMTGLANIIKQVILTLVGMKIAMVALAIGPPLIAGITSALTAMRIATLYGAAGFGVLAVAIRSALASTGIGLLVVGLGFLVGKFIETRIAASATDKEIRFMESNGVQAFRNMGQAADLMNGKIGGNIITLNAVALAASRAADETENAAIKRVKLGRIPPIAVAVPDTKSDTSFGNTTKAVKGLSAAAKLAQEQMKTFGDELTRNNDVLAKAKDAYNGFRDGIVNVVKSIIDFSSAATAETGSFIENLIAQSAKAVDFGTKVRKLLAMGLSESAIGQVLAAGADVGIKIADEIIAGGATVVDQVNSLIGATESVAVTLGEAAAVQFYQAGVTSGQALVDGIRAAILASGFNIDSSGNITNPLEDVPEAVQQTALTSKAKSAPVKPTAAKSIPKAPAKSPIDQGLLNKLKNIPMLAAGGIVTRATLAMIGESGPEAVVPLSGRNSAMGNVYNINVNAGMGTNGAQVGKEIVDAIKRFEKTSGPVFASA